MIEHLKTKRTLIKKCNEYNVPLHLAFVEYNKPLDSAELWALTVYSANRVRMIQRSIERVMLEFSFRGHI